MIVAGCRFVFTKYLAADQTRSLGTRVPRKIPTLHRKLNNGSTRVNSLTPVKLAYISWESEGRNPYDKAEDSPIIIMHGFLDSKDNWHYLSEAINRRTSRKVIAVDMRNHGESPHTSDMTYSHAAADLSFLVKKLEIEKAIMIGHSMGGRVMMHLALTQPEIVDKILTIDMSPISTSPKSMSILSLIGAMKKVTLDENLSLAQSRRLADQQLSTSIKSTAIRQRLLRNLIETKVGKCQWRINLPVLEETFPNILTFPPSDNIFNSPALFVGGDRSDHLNTCDHEPIKKLFPKARIQYLPETGHCLHEEKPEELLDIITAFINETQ